MKEVFNEKGITHNLYDKRLKKPKKIRIINQDRDITIQNKKIRRVGKEWIRF